MKRIFTLLIGSWFLLFAIGSLLLLLSTSACFAQVYTVTDLGTLGGSQSAASGINNSGRVVGWALTSENALHPFCTAPNRPINPATDDLGTLGGASSGVVATGINASGEVVGNSFGFFTHAFRTAANHPINPITDDLGTLGGDIITASSINDSGQAVGSSLTSSGNLVFHAFRTAANRPINPITDDLGTLSGGDLGESWASGINASGQVVGKSFTGGTVHAFRTAANRRINSVTDDLGTLGGANSWADAINIFGQAVGAALTSGNIATHAFRVDPRSPINPATDDLGTLGGTYSEAAAIDAFGQVVGLAYTSGNSEQHAFLYSNGAMHDLNTLIAADSSCDLAAAVGINNAGQIAASGNCNGQPHAVRLDPIYKSFVQPPINGDGSSVFTAKRRVVPVKFTLAQYGIPTCGLLPATIAVIRAANGTLDSVDESTYSMQADSDSNFRIDSTACQYVYNLAASALGVGTYRVDISINGIMVGHAVFALK